jgi:hypothetical protein
MKKYLMLFVAAILIVFILFVSSAARAVVIPARAIVVAPRVAPAPAPRIVTPAKPAIAPAGASHEAVNPMMVTPVIVPHTPSAPVAKRPASAASKAK